MLPPPSGFLLGGRALFLYLFFYFFFRVPEGHPSKEILGFFARWWPRATRVVA
jgi:hypothetical protein